jgi:hypothetical protein
LIFRGDHPQAVKGDEMVPAIAAQLREFQASIAAKGNPTAGIETMTASLRLSDAVWTSLSEHRPVRLEEK